MDDAIGLRDAMRSRQVGDRAGRRIDRHARRREHGEGRRRGDGGRVAAACAVELFRAAAPAIIERAFARQGVRMLMGRTPACVERHGDGCAVTLDNGKTIVGRPAAGLHRGQAERSASSNGSGIETDVRHPGRRPHAHQCRRHLGRRRRGAGARLLGRQGGQRHPAERGRAGPHRRRRHGAKTPACKPFSGAVPLNTYSFFGHHAISVGLGGQLPDGPGSRSTKQVDDERGVIAASSCKDGRLVGISSINDFVDPGIMWQLILRAHRSVRRSRRRSSPIRRRPGGS